MTHLLLTALVAVSLVGCGGRERSCTNGEDDDGDGFADCSDQDCSDECGEQCSNLLDDDGNGKVDCEDRACACGTIDPTAEICDDGVDQDGDWFFDCDDPDCRSTCDADGDGFVSIDRSGDDCDDDDADVKPGAIEVPYNGADDDCDPNTLDDDLDGDGHLGADDCDDLDAWTYPGAPETCGDGRLNDCLGLTTPERSDCFGERSVLTADATLLGPSTDNWTGISIASIGDVNDDGLIDLAIGAYGDGSVSTGAVFIAHGPFAGVHDLSLAEAKWLGESEDDWAGFSIDAGHDLTGNGMPDLLVGARYDDATGHNGGGAYVVPGDLVGNYELSQSVSKIFSEAIYDSAGYSVASVGDVGGDLYNDVLIGALFNATGGLNAGAAYVVPGPIVGPVQLGTTAYKLVGEGQDDNAGCAVGAAGDLDGDGLQDVLVGACLSDRNGPNSGTAYQFSTHLEVERLLTDADGAMLGEMQQDQLGSALAGADLNGDGRSDVLVGAPYNDAAGIDAGAVYIASGPASTNMNSPDVTLYGQAAGDRAGTSVSGADDIDGDGFTDLLVGAPGSDAGGEDAGMAAVVFGPPAGELSVADADIRLIGAASFDFAGHDVASVGDLDLDGFPDIAVSAPYHDGTAPSGGATYLFRFGF